MTPEPPWLRWARRVQALAQTGLHYAQSTYDRERYGQLRELAAEMFAAGSNLDEAAVRAVFDREEGYATPKVDVRGAVFQDGRLLLVREAADGLWTLPGGWADVNDSPAEAVEREIREESGFEAKATHLIALYDRAKHPHLPPFPFHVYKLFFGCEWVGGSVRTSHETSAVAFFEEKEIPPLSETRVLPEQIARCFAWHRHPQEPTYFE